VEDPTTKTIYAVKSLSSENGKLIAKEMELLLNKNLVNPYLLRYYALLSEKEKTHIFMEYCELGDIEQWVNSQKGYIGEEVRACFCI
jgi:hypothetical protein